MGAGNQGGGSSPEDAAIRRDATARGEDPSVTRQFFRDRDSGKLAARSYLDSRPTDRTMPDGSPMDDTFAEMIDSRLGNIGVTRDDTSFVNADGRTVGGINPAGNFFGGREVIDALRGTPSLTDMRRAASREAKFGPGSRAAQEGDIDTSLIDMVDYAEDGTVQGLGPNRFMDQRGTGQLVYDPSAVIPGLPYLQDPQNDVFVPQYDPSRESAVGRGLQRGVDFIGQGGMMGAVTRGLGGLFNRDDEILKELEKNPIRGGYMSRDGGITNALMGGADSVNKLTSEELANLPQFAGGFTGSGVNNPFLSSSQKGELNPYSSLNLDVPTRMSQQGPNFTAPPVQFDASGSLVPFDGGDRISKPLGIGTLPVVQPDPATLAFASPIFDFVEKERDRVRADRPIFDTRDTATQEADRLFGRGFSSVAFDPILQGDRGFIPTNIQTATPDDATRFETPVVDQTQRPFGSLFRDQRADRAAREFASGVGSTGAQISETPTFELAADPRVPYTPNPIFDRVQEKDFGMYGSAADELANTQIGAPPFNVNQAEFRPNMQLDELNRFQGPKQEEILRQAELLREEAKTPKTLPPDPLPVYTPNPIFDRVQEKDFGMYGSAADELANTQIGSPPFNVDQAEFRPNMQIDELNRFEGPKQEEILRQAELLREEGRTATGDIPFPFDVRPNADLITGRPTLAFQDENFGVDSDVTDFSVAEDDLARIRSELASARTARDNINALIERDLRGLPRDRQIGELLDPSGSNLNEQPRTIGDAFRYIGEDLKRIYNEDPAVVARRNQAPLNENMYGTSMFDLSDELPMTISDAGKIIETSSAFPPRVSEPTTLFPSAIEAVATNARAKRLANLEKEGPFGTEDLRDPVETIYDDADQLEDLMTTAPISPSGANVGVGGGDGGGPVGPVQCPPGYEPMILESGETVCVPVEEAEVVEEDTTTPTTPVPIARPTIGDSPYTPQAVSNIAPFRLQPGSSGGGLADILQLQNYPTIV